MSKALSTAIRCSIIAEYNKGKNISALSREFSVTRRTIQILLKRYKSSGDLGLQPKYSNCGKERPKETNFIFRAVRFLRHYHPSWGAEKIYSEIKYKYPDRSLPHHRTMTRWFYWNGQLESKCRNDISTIDFPAASNPHDCWQIDAKEEMRTADGKKQCWLNIVDEKTGMVIEPPVFPLKKNM